MNAVCKLWRKVSWSEKGAWKKRSSKIFDLICLIWLIWMIQHHLFWLTKATERGTGEGRFTKVELDVWTYKMVTEDCFQAIDINSCILHCSVVCCTSPTWKLLYWSVHTMNRQDRPWIMPGTNNCPGDVSHIHISHCTNILSAPYMV